MERENGYENDHMMNRVCQQPDVSLMSHQSACREVAIGLILTLRNICRISVPGGVSVSISVRLGLGSIGIIRSRHKLGKLHIKGATGTTGHGKEPFDWPSETDGSPEDPESNNTNRTVPLPIEPGTVRLGTRVLRVSA